MYQLHTTNEAKKKSNKILEKTRYTSRVQYIHICSVYGMECGLEEETIEMGVSQSTALPIPIEEGNHPKIIQFDNKLMETGIETQSLAFSNLPINRIRASYYFNSSYTSSVVRWQ